MTDRGFKRRADPANSLEGYTLVKDDLADPNTRGQRQGINKISYFNMMECLHFRRPFISQRGFVGLGPAGLEVGDVVVIFEGAKLPYLLRQLKIDGEEGVWKLVGEAYVHGIMYGEFMKQERQTETFSIF
jgi:hypothetical protein